MNGFEISLLIFVMYIILQSQKEKTIDDCRIEYQKVSRDQCHVQSRVGKGEKWFLGDPPAVRGGDECPRLTYALGRWSSLCTASMTVTEIEGETD